jgi:hypothetical protein
MPLCMQISQLLDIIMQDQFCLLCPVETTEDSAQSFVVLAQVVWYHAAAYDILLATRLDAL